MCVCVCACTHVFVGQRSIFCIFFNRSPPYGVERLNQEVKRRKAWWQTSWRVKAFWILLAELTHSRWKVSRKASLQQNQWLRTEGGWPPGESLWESEPDAGLWVGVVIGQKVRRRRRWENSLSGLRLSRVTMMSSAGRWYTSHGQPLPGVWVAAGI